jgi:hypothetical protein
MTQQQALKVGDRVTINDRNKDPNRIGTTATVKFVSGSEVWVVYDGTNEVSPPMHRWFLDPA